MMFKRRRARPGQAGFTLIELMIAVALLGVGLAFITNMFLNGWRLWKRSFDELILQRNARDTMAVVTRALREAKPGTVQIGTPANGPQFSQITFTTGQNVNWKVWQSNSQIKYFSTTTTGMSTTLLLASSDVGNLYFVYSSNQDLSLVDVGLTCTKIPYSQARMLVVQLVERVRLRNP